MNSGISGYPTINKHITVLKPLSSTLLMKVLAIRYSKDMDKTIQKLLVKSNGRHIHSLVTFTHIYLDSH